MRYREEREAGALAKHSEAMSAAGRKESYAASPLTNDDYRFRNRELAKGLGALSAAP
jgi:hypothetical protein